MVKCLNLISSVAEQLFIGHRFYLFLSFCSSVRTSFLMGVDCAPVAPVDHWHCYVLVFYALSFLMVVDCVLVVPVVHRHCYVLVFYPLSYLMGVDCAPLWPMQNIGIALF